MPHNRTAIEKVPRRQPKRFHAGNRKDLQHPSEPRLAFCFEYDPFRKPVPTGSSPGQAFSVSCSSYSLYRSRLRRTVFDRNAPKCP